MICRLIVLVPALLLSLQSTVLAVNVRDVVFTPKGTGRVVFSHRVHLDNTEMSNNCRACHDGLYDLKNKKHFTMSDMNKGRSCGACHTGSKAFPLAECARCHQTKEITFKVKATGATVFSHATHGARSADCSTCHPALFATRAAKRFTMAEMAKGKSCGACHNGRKAFGISSCVSCHPAREITFQVAETGPTHFSHKSHLARERCSACHPKLYTPDQRNRRTGMAAMEKGRSCGACHNARQAFPVKECTRCHPTREVLFEEKSTGNVTFSHAFHSGLYSCADCHPSRYRPVRSTVKVTMTDMEQGKSCGSCHDGKAAFSVREKCEVCHKM